MYLRNCWFNYKYLHSIFPWIFINPVILKLHIYSTNTSVNHTLTSILPPTWPASHKSWRHWQPDSHLVSRRREMLSAVRGMSADRLSLTMGMVASIAMHVLCRSVAATMSRPTLSASASTHHLERLPHSSILVRMYATKRSMSSQTELRLTCASGKAPIGSYFVFWLIKFDVHCLFLLGLFDLGRFSLSANPGDQQMVSFLQNDWKRCNFIEFCCW